MSEAIGVGWAIGLVATALLAAVPAHAQDMGFHGGLARTNLWSPDTPLAPDANINFTGGISLRPTPGIQTGLMYARRSAGITLSGARDPDGQTVDAAAGITLEYVEIPIIGRYSRRRVVHWIAGPVLAFKLSCEAEASISRIGMVETDCERTGFDAKFFDLGLALGMGLTIPLNGRSVLIDLLYNIGLRSIIEADTVKHRAFGFTLGFSP